MLIAALFTIAKTWEQPKYLWTDEWIRRCVCVCVCVYKIGISIHNGVLLSHQKESNSAICKIIDGPRDYHTKQSKKEKYRYHMISLIGGI